MATEHGEEFIYQQNKEDTQRTLSIESCSEYKKNGRFSNKLFPNSAVSIQIERASLYEDFF